MASEWTRNQVLDRIRPRAGRGDRKILEVFTQETGRGERKITRAEAKRIAYAARDGRQVTEREDACLQTILGYQGITPEAKRYLHRFARMSRAYRGERDIWPMSDTLERQKIQVIQGASRIPVQFTLPDKPYRVYKFETFNRIAKLLSAGLITLFRYKGKSHGVYHSKADCLMFDYHGREAHEKNATIIHEATHAVQDVLDWDGDRGHTEAASHLTQAVWLRVHGKPLEGRLAQPGIGDIARQIHQHIASVRDRNQVLTFRISSTGYQGIRKVLKTAYRIEEPAAKKSGDTL